MALRGQEIQFFMSVGISATPIPDQSFEELRVQDYLKTYMTTGQPPTPCPQSPDTPNAREALGLPPLFVPVAIPTAFEPNTNHATSSFGSTSGAVIRLPTELPPNHAFQATKSPIGEFFQSISAQTLYSHFSHEELRHHAYLAGNTVAPTGTEVVSATANMSSAPVEVHQFFARDSSATAYMTASAMPGTPDYFMSISTSSKFDKHSFEELRIAYLLAGKEVGSSEIPMRGGLPAQPAPNLIGGRPRGDAFSSTSTLKLF
ncbi:hypothetical protein HYDPIDRAFT_110250 [Hydnomerulius pinastri MD-312]|nr:hypothetical protein HYDPIDRAFT_110250 [Hydnomerulius pinastri MD-312]